MIDLRKYINESINKNNTNKFWVNVLWYMDGSIEDLSLENNKFLSFITLFDDIDDGTNVIHWQADFSKCLYDLIALSDDQLKLLKSFLEYVSDNINSDDHILIKEDIIRGLKDIQWLLDVNFFYQNLINSFDRLEKLADYEVIDISFKGSDPQLEKYFINLLSDIDLSEIDSNDLLLFLKGYDFYLLSNKAYYFVLPACMKLCIDMFRKNEYSSSPEEYMSFFLQDKTRADNASLEIRKLVNRFIKLLSHQSYYFLSFYDYNLDKLIKIWEIKD